jgi:hypothetical protein
LAFSSSNDPVRSSQHIQWNRQADLFGGLEIDDELKFSRLLDWQILRLTAAVAQIVPHHICT